MGSRALRVGAAAILCALTLRLFASGLPGKLLSWLTSPDTAAFLIYLETGRDVRFSPSQEAFSVDFVESPPPAAPEPTEPPLPSFSDPEMVKLYYACSVSPDIGALMEQPLNWDLTGDQPTVLILHTHSTEAYAQDSAAPYQESGTARTTDPSYNIIKVGEEITRIFEEMGLSVIHDTNLYDYPDYNGAYERSKAAAAQYLAQYPTLQMVLDVHRDALVGADGTVYKPVLQIDGVKTAQVMLLVGSDDAGAVFPDWTEHMALAMELQQQMNSLWPGLARPITLRTARFNQQMTKGSLLVEVGSHGNTLDEALAGARLFARSAAKVLLTRVG